MDIEYSNDKNQPNSSNNFEKPPQHSYNTTDMNTGGFFFKSTNQNSNYSHISSGNTFFKQPNHSNSNYQMEEDSSFKLRNKYFLSDDEDDEYREDDNIHEEDIDMYNDQDPNLSQLVPEESGRLF